VVLRRDPSDAPSRGQTTTTSWSKALHGDLDAIVLKSLRTDPAARYASCADFAEDLRAWLQSRPVVARRGGVVYRMQRYARRHWLPLSVGTAVFLGLLGFSWTLYRHSVELEAARVLAESERAEAQATSAFLTRLFTESNPNATGTAALSARDLLERGMENLGADSSMSTAQRIALLQTVARAFLGIDSASQAGQALKLADDLTKVSSGNPGIDPVLQHRVKSAAAFARTDFVSAVDSMRAALDAAIAGGAGSETRYELEIALARLMMQSGRTEDALVAAMRLVEALGHAPGSALFWDAVKLNSRVVGVLSREDERLALFLKHQESITRGLNPSDPKRGEFLFELGAAHYRLGHFKAARENYVEASAIAAQAFGIHSQRAQAVQAGLANVELALGNYDTAIETYRTLIASQQVLGRDRDMLLNTVNLSSALQKAGKTDEAWQLAQTIVERAKDMWPGGHPNQIIFSNHKAQLALKTRRLDEAEHAYHASLALIESLTASGVIKESPRLKLQAEQGLQEIRSQRAPP
jgi:serine/threonine-protein kinase